ncbi:hypothetical protein BH10PLA2_BH10PLA2_17680 [soil metagenome]
MKLWELADRGAVLLTQGHLKAPECLAWRADGKQIASGAADTTARLWDAQTGTELEVLRGHKADVNALCYLLGGTQVMTCGRDSGLRVWDTSTGREIAMFSGPASPGPVMVVTREGKVALWTNASLTSEIQVFDPTTGDKIKSMPVHERGTACQAFSPDGSIGVVGDRGGAVRFWNLLTNERIGGDLAAHKSIADLAITNDQQVLVTGGDDGEIKIWNGKARTLLHTVSAHTERVSSISLRPDGKRFLSSGADHCVKLWDTATGKELRSWKNVAANAVLFSPDGKLGVTANHDTTLYLLDCNVN